MTPGIQLRTPAQLAGLQDATGVRGIHGLWRRGNKGRFPHLHSPDYGYDELYSFENQNRETPVLAG